MLRHPPIDRLAVRERLARGHSSASAESDGFDPDEPVVVSEPDWLAAIALAKRIYADYLDLMSGSGPKDAYLYSAAVELFVDSHDYDLANILSYASSRGINITSVSDVNDLHSAVYALLWAYTEAEVFVETPELLD